MFTNARALVPSKIYNYQTSRLKEPINQQALTKVLLCLQCWVEKRFNAQYLCY